MYTFKEYYQQIMENCWKGYKQEGMKRKKRKGKKAKMVPNCVPK